MGTELMLMVLAVPPPESVPTEAAGVPFWAATLMVELATVREPSGEPAVPIVAVALVTLSVALFSVIADGQHRQ